MWFITGDENSTVLRFGRLWASVPLICTQSTRSIVPGNARAEVVLAARARPHTRRVVLVHCRLDPVDIRQPLNEVIRMSHVAEPDVRAIRVEHPGAGADDRFPFLEVAAVLLDDLLGHDRDRMRVREHV